MNRTHVLNEEKSKLVKKLVKHWLAATGGQPAKIQDFADFLKSKPIQKFLPYSEEITDEVINDVTDDYIGGDAGNEPAEKSKDATSDKKQAYIDRVTKIVKSLNDASKKELLRMID